MLLSHKFQFIPFQSEYVDSLSSLPYNRKGMSRIDGGKGEQNRDFIT